LPPGFGAAGDNPFENGQGLGNIPPGIAKLFGYGGFGDDDVPEDLPPGFEAAGDNPFENSQGLGNIPPGQLKKFEATFYQSPDDFVEEEFEGTADDEFEKQFDKTNKGIGKSKAKFEFPRNEVIEGKEVTSGGGGGGGNDTTICHNGVLTLNISSNALPAHTPPGHPNDTLGPCEDDRIFDNGAELDEGIVGTQYTAEDFTAFQNGNDFTDNIRLDVFDPNGTKTSGNPSKEQPYSFTPNTNGDWTITAKAVGLTALDRTVDVSGGPTSDAGSNNNQSITTNPIDLDGSGTGTGTLSFTWEEINHPGGPAVTINSPNMEDTTVTIPNNGVGKTYEFQLTVRDDVGYAVSTVQVTIDS